MMLATAGRVSVWTQMLGGGRRGAVDSQQARKQVSKQALEKLKVSNIWLGGGQERRLGKMALLAWGKLPGGRRLLHGR